MYNQCSAHVIRDNYIFLFGIISFEFKRVLYICSSVFQLMMKSILTRLLNSHLNVELC